MTLKKQTLLLFSSILILAFVMTGCGQKPESDTPDGADDVVEQPLQEEITYVKSEKVSTQSFTNDLTLPGKAEPIQTVVVSTKTAGDVESADYDIGDTVEEGTVLLTLDDQDHRIMANTAKLGLDQAKITLDTAKDDLDRNRQLFNSGAISKTTLDAIENGYKKASIGYKTAKNSYDTASINLGNTTIEAPISGIVSNKQFAIGENVNPGTNVYTIVNIDEMNVILGVPEQYIHGLKTGQEVTLKAQYGDDTWSGTVVNISPVMEERSFTYTTKVLVNNEAGNMRAGMSLDVIIKLDEPRENLAFNKLGLILEEEDTYVYINNNGRAKLMPVTIGTTNEDYYEIIDGLKTGDEVITEGSGMLEDGDLIEIKN